MKLLGICFGDNDFQHTVEAFLEALLLRYKSWAVTKYPLDIDEQVSPACLTKEEIVNLFNKTIYSIYLIHQAGEHDRPHVDSPEWNLQEYLHIASRNIYFDNEVIRVIQGQDKTIGGGEFTWIDLAQQKVFSY